MRNLCDPVSLSFSQVINALTDLSSTDQLSVSGTAGGPWQITFVGTHTGINQPSLNGDAAALISGTEIREMDYSYDASSQLSSASDPDSAYAYTYDNLGQVLTVDNYGTPDVPNVVLTSAYNAAGRRTSLTASIASTDDFVNSYSYDALHRLTQIDQTGQSGGNTVAEKRVDLAYNAIGQFTSIARFNDTSGGSGDEVATSNFTYDTLGRLTDLAYKNGGTNLFTPFSWSFDNLSRVTQFVSADGTSDYSYDKTGQLTVADHNYQSDEAYSYDANGNRTMSGYTTGSNNQLTNDGTYSYTYDDEGNRLTRTNDSTSESTEYTWDFRNRLTKVTEKDSYGSATQVVEYTYDVFNRRIGKAIDTTSPFTMADAVIERYVYDDANGVSSIDGGNVVLDFVDPDGSGSTPIALSKRYLYGNAVDQLFAQEDVTVSTSSADRVLWPLADNLGTVRDLAKNDGTLGEHYTYDSYGNIQSGDTSLTRYLYTSREYDPDTGLQYNRARWYDPAVGKWISEDPLGFAAGDPNVTRYVRNHATLSTDPSGLQEPEPLDTRGVFLELQQQRHNFWIVIFSTADTRTEGSIQSIVNGHAWVGLVNNNVNLPNPLAAPNGIAVGMHPLAQENILTEEVPSRLMYEMDEDFLVARAYPVNQKQLVQAMRILQDQMRTEREYNLADWNCASLVVKIIENVIDAPGVITPVLLVEEPIVGDLTVSNYSPGVVGEYISGPTPLNGSLFYNGNGGGGNSTTPTHSP